MALYEHTVMTRQDISAQQAEALNDTIKALIEEPLLARRERERDRDRPARTDEAAASE
ncbi:MAG: hypothetical protein IE910_03845 [Brevundimonas sp.]|nr:hypothetical protein [Brevundimonas sp.]